DGIFIGAPSFNEGARWSWPLQVAVLDKGRSSFRRALLQEPSSLVSNFVEFVEPEGPTECDLLVVPAGLRSATAQIIERRLKVAAILLLAPLRESWERTHALVEVLMGDTGAGAIGFVNPGASESEWFDDLLAELSHDAG